MTEKAPCGACDACEHCPFPDCTWDGVTSAEWDTAKAEDASARHFGESKLAAQQRAYYEANREKIAAKKRECRRRKKADHEVLRHRLPALHPASQYVPGGAA